MDRDTAIKLLQAHEAELRCLGVQHLYLFGSTARGEARPDSGVDLFFDHEWGQLIPTALDVDPSRRMHAIVMVRAGAPSTPWFLPGKAWMVRLRGP